MNLKFEQYPSKINSKPKKLVIFLHGYGSNAQDLITLSPEFEKYIDGAVYISPNAPFSYEGGEYGGYQWYSLIDRDPDKLLEGFNKALPVLEDFINIQLKNFSLVYSDLILIGFSQGGMMTLQSSLVREHKICSAISFSGYIVNHKNFYQDIRSRPPIFMSHGKRDTVVPFNASTSSVDLLQRCNLTVEHYIAPKLGHGIDLACIQAAGSFYTKLHSS